jgi:hypothetical protein
MQILIRFLSFSACFLTFFAAPRTSFADGIVASNGITLGGQAGAGILSDVGGTHFELGLEAMYNLLGPVSVGAGAAPAVSGLPKFSGPPVSFFG